MSKDTVHFFNPVSVNTLVANGYVGSAGQALVSNGSTVYWSDNQGKITTQAATPPTPAYEGQIWFDSENIKTYVYYDGFWIEIGSSEVATLYNRATFTTTTGSLAPNASVNINLPAYKSYALLSVNINSECWLRLYTDENSRTADESRNINTDPVAGSGVVAEIITTGSETVKMTPFVFGGNLTTVPTNDMYLRATNLATATTDINIQITLIRLEQ
jgi:hypothetical protein